MKIPIEDDYSNSTRIIIEDCESELVSNDYNKMKKDVIIIDTTYNETLEVEDRYSKDYSEYYQTELKQDFSVKSDISGKITVISRLATVNGALISSAKINLYMLNGLSPKLIERKESDDGGVVIFNNLEAGSYRVIAIVDRKYFEKPVYFDWNEVTLDNEMQEANITVVNKIKSNFKK